MPDAYGHGRGTRSTEKAKDLKGAAATGSCATLAHDRPIVLIVAMACAVGSVAFSVDGPARAR
ncbi:MAG: hypothetical protein ACLTSX_00460 [Collinsella sp.]